MVDWTLVKPQPKMVMPGWTYPMFETIPLLEIDRLYPGALVMLDHQDPTLLELLESDRARFISEAWSYAEPPGSHRLRVSFPLDADTTGLGKCLRWLPWSGGGDFPGVWVRYTVSPAGCGDKRPPRMFEAELVRVRAWVNGWLRAHLHSLECVALPLAGAWGGHYADAGELVFKHPDRVSYYSARYGGDELVRIPEFLRRINDWDWCKSHNL